MRLLRIVIGLVFAVQGTLLPALAQETNDTQRLLKVIEEQQRQLDAQEAQLLEQKKALEEVRRQVAGLPSAKPPATAKPAMAGTPPPISTGQTNQASFPGLEKAAKSAAASKESWPGSFEVEAINTRFKISGFVEMDVIYDNDAILTPSAFLPHAIVTGDASPAQGSDGQTHFSIQPTRLSLETRTPLDDRQFRTWVSVDFFNDFGSTTPELRLREAYGELSNILFGGDLLLGQDWSTYANLYSIPNVLDFQGVNSLYGTRHPLLRWTKPLGSGWSLKLAAEAPDVRQFENASSASTWPDGVAAVVWATEAFNLQASFLARDLRAEGNTTGQLVSEFGWGAALSGRIQMPGALKQDFAVFSVTYGEGIGGVFNDVPADATYDPATSQFGAIPTLAWYVGYQHWWNPKFYSVICYGQIDQDNLSFQGPTAYKKTQYGSANLTWVPSPHWLLGVEALYGSREDNDGAKGEVIRTQFTTRFMF